MITPKTPMFANTAYRLAGEDHSRGGLLRTPDLKFDTPIKFSISRIKTGEQYKYTYKVNDKIVDEFTVVPPNLNNKITFYGYKTNILIDNFNISEVK